MGKKRKTDLNIKKRKIGRNDPCPCGSGFKYKKCCIDKTRSSMPNSYSMLDNSAQKDFISDVQKSKQKRQNNHYIPVGYQKRFIPDEQKELYYLDMDPIYKDLPDGRRVKTSRELRRQGPKSCFYKKDLYTTKFFGSRNEDIETFLFGKIDDNVHNAFDGLISNNPHILHKYFQYIFEYIDAQKLRTPKGLDWICSNYFQLTKNELLLEMQFLRTMHCTMWVEGVMEIVSAEDSDIKFIISDHPVTIYNYACSPDSATCQYPNDPLTAWKASQTIFPLDLNHSLILTNLEYASSPDEADPTSGRTNPRFFSQTITRWDTIIRERRLRLEEVCAINYIIKKRARKYIAAGKKEWLYPEKIYSKNQWKSLRKILLPPKNKVSQFRGEIYVGGKDGSLVWYQDAFGRRHTSREDENDPIRKYSIRKRNEILNNAICKIFGFDEGKSWDDFRKELTDDKIKELYRVVGMLWNPDTELTNLLPRPQNNELRAFYHGSLDPRVIPLTVIGYSLYVDKVVMYSPFLNPRVMNKEYSPYENPGQYGEDTIKNVSMMMELMPLIDSGIIEMMPDPCEFNPELRMRTYEMAEARMKYRSIDTKDMDFAHKLMREDMKKFMFCLPPDILRHKFKKKLPDASDEDVEEALEYIEKKKLADPLASLQPIDIGEKKGRLQIYRMSGTHEMALYLAQVTGSFVYTDIKHCWNEYKASELKKLDERNIDPWEPLIKALNEHGLIMYSNPDSRFWPRIKEKGYFKEFIDFYKSVLESVRTISNPEHANTKAKEYAEHLKKINLENIFKRLEADYKKEFENHDNKSMSQKIKIPASYFMPINGISSNTVTQILLTHGINRSYWSAVPFGVYLDLNGITSI
jgi:hypothetical protein